MVSDFPGDTSFKPFYVPAHKLCFACPRTQRARPCGHNLSCPRFPLRGRVLLHSFQLVVPLQQRIEFPHPLLEREIRNAPNHYGRNQPVQRFTSAEIKIPIAFAQTLIPAPRTESIINHLAGYAVLGRGSHDGHDSLPFFRIPAIKGFYRYRK